MVCLICLDVSSITYSRTRWHNWFTATVVSRCLRGRRELWTRGLFFVQWTGSLERTLAWFIHYKHPVVHFMAFPLSEVQVKEHFISCLLNVKATKMAFLPSAAKSMYCKILSTGKKKKKIRGAPKLFFAHCPKMYLEAVYWIALEVTFTLWKDILRCFVHWEGTLEGTLPHYVHWRGIQRAL